MIEATITVVTLIADGFIAALTGKVTDELAAKIRSGAARDAFQQALVAAIRRYAEMGGLRLDLAQALLQRDGPLMEPAVAGELAKMVSFIDEPDASLIGEQWKRSIPNPPAWRDFGEEARLLLGHLRAELRRTEVFRPVFEARSIDRIAAATTTSAESLAMLNTQMADLIHLISSSLAELTRIFAASPPDIRAQIRDYTQYIEEKTRGFVGRRFVFDAVDQFTNENRRGYFIIRGDPGIGKTAFAAQLVRTRKHIHHFNIQAEGINRADSFLRNICAQLIAAYDLNLAALPADATRDAGVLNRLLGEVSNRLRQGEQAVIVVDALDEADSLGMPKGANTLYLPMMLPQGIYMVVTTRKTPLSLRIDCEQQTLDIEQDQVGNIADIGEYVEQEAIRPGIQAYIVAQGIDTAAFVEHLVEKSQGNFMYLRYVLPEIERGAYKDRELATIPVGLKNYYEDNWQRMRGQDESAWFAYKLPVLMALTVVKEPVSIELLSDFSEVAERSRIRAVLNEWQQFLHEEEVVNEGALQKRYRVYHASFHDFIADKEEIAEERVNRKAAHEKIANKLWKDLMGEG